MALSANIIRELRTYFLSLDRKNVISGDLKPAVDDTLRIGAPDKKIHAIYVNRIIADEIEGDPIGGGGGEATGGHADTLGDDYLSALDIATDGYLYPLGTGAVFPSGVLPTDIVYENSTPTFTSINVTNYVDGISVSAHDHSGSANMGVQVSHANLLNLSADHHTIYTRWDDTETVIKKWKFSNLAEENQDFNEYVGWEIEASVVLEENGGWHPVMDTAQAVLQTLSFSDPTYGHSYPMKIISHAQYSSIQLGTAGELELLYDSSDISATVGNIILSNTDGITVGSTFEVTQGGVMTATSGYIGTWQILSDKLQSTSGDVILDSDGYIFLTGSSVELRMSSIHADYRLWVGGSGESTWDETTAKFIVNVAGEVTAETVAVKGLIHNYGADKWKITSDGHAEFESIKARGRLDTLVFTKSTVSSISGVMALANGSVLAQDMTDSQTYFYLDAPEFEFGDIVLLQPSADNMEWMLIISSFTQMVIQNADGEDVTVYKYTVSRDFDDFGTSFAFEEGIAVNGRGSYSVGNDPLPLASGDEQGAFGDYQPSGTYSGAGGGWITLDGESTHITVNVRTGPLPDQYQQFVRIGNLQGMLNYTEIEWGFVIGDENNYMTYDQTDGLIIYSRGGDTTINADGITSDAFIISLAASEPTSAETDTAILYYYDDKLKMLYDDTGSEELATVLMSVNGVVNVPSGTAPYFIYYEDDTADHWWRVGADGGNFFFDYDDDQDGLFSPFSRVLYLTSTKAVIERLEIHQTADNSGMIIYGHDDESTEYLSSFIASDGTTYISTSTNIIITNGAGYLVLRSAGSIYNDLGDAAGAQKIIVRDSAYATVATIDSDGGAIFKTLEIELTAGYDACYNNVNSGTAKTITWANGNVQKVTATGNCTFTFTAPPKVGHLALVIIGNGTSYTFTFPATVKWVGAGEPSWNFTSAKKNIVSFLYDGTDYIAAGGEAN